MGMSSGNSGKGGVQSDINVTPLVDVMLVLLIIFMLMTLIMGRGHDVNLPKAHNYSQEKDKMQPVVSIDLEGLHLHHDRHHDEEDDQQHEQDVDQRRDVDVTGYAALASAG